MNEVELGHGTLRDTDTDPGGAGRVVVLVHGLFVDGSLWRDVVPGLTAHCGPTPICPRPVWPRGSPSS